MNHSVLGYEVIAATCIIAAAVSTRLPWTSRRYLGLLCVVALGAGAVIPGATWLRLAAALTAAATLIVLVIRWKAHARTGS